MRTRMISCLSLVALVAVLAGCGKKSAPATVSGTVKYNGSPVTGGMLVFYSDAGPYSASIGADGTYTLADMPAGDMVVTVDTEGLNPKNQKSPEYKGQGGGTSGMYGKASGGSSPPPGAKGKGAQMSPAPEGAATGQTGTYMKIPAKYADKDKTDLKVTIGSGKQTINLDLKD